MDVNSTMSTQSPDANDANPPKFKTEKVRKAPRVPRKKDPVPTVPSRTPMPFPSASFTIEHSYSSSSTRAPEGTSELEPRTGSFTLKRQGDDGKEDIITVETPGMICGASRGMLKHLSRDNVARANGVEWIHVPFEDFLEHPVPIPTLHPASLPLHQFLTHPSKRHILSLSLRDASDNQNMPANTNAWVQAKTVRGVRKVTINDWIKWCKDARPDLVWAFVDVPKTLLLDDGEEVTAVGTGEGRQVSQKRITKSLERSVGWVQLLLAGMKDQSFTTTEHNQENSEHASASLPPIIVPLVGGCDPRAREEFSRSLVEKQDRLDVTKSGGLKRLDDGIFGYAMEMVDLPTNYLGTAPTAQPNAEMDEFTELLHASFIPLPSNKIRIAHTTPSPHVILQLVLKCGFDLFDAPFATEAADLGIALDFQFPIQDSDSDNAASRDGKKRPIGSNLFEEKISLDFSPLGGTDLKHECWPCAPSYESSRMLHSKLDEAQWNQDKQDTSPAGQPFTRAYVHHLLHTHEMSAYALLHLHNIAVMHQFFKSIRTQLQTLEKDAFEKETIKFYENYELPQRLFEEARVQWKEVELARGKGRLKREREAAGNLGDPPMVNVDQIAVVEGIENAI